jgi:hypothetical protein
MTGAAIYARREHQIAITTPQPAPPAPDRQQPCRSDHGLASSTRQLCMSVE